LRVLVLALIVCWSVWLTAGCVASVALPGEQQACELEPQRAEDFGSTSEALSALSCKMSVATGYESGKAFKIQVVAVDGKSVEWRTANAYMAMANAAAAAGVQLRVVSGFRTMAEQKYLYGCYTHCNCNSCALAAVPGTSNHQSGHALDLNTSASGIYGWLSKHAGKFGFKRTVPGELWHWEWWGADDGTGPCNGDTLEAKLVHEWSSLPLYDGKKAEFLACTGQKFELGLTFKNKGSAVWRDVAGRGSSMGSDVFLTTLSGKKDPLTGAKHYSIRHDANAKVRGDHDAKSCSDHDGCNKTLFVQGGMHAKAPVKPGIYTSAWRLRDYSKVWGKSKGFGPKVKVRIKVEKCQASKVECGCRVWCSDGTSQVLAAGAVLDGASCKALGQTVCKPATLTSSSFDACAGSAGGSPSTDGSANPSAGDSTDPVPDGWNGWTAGDEIQLTSSEPDDPGFDDGNFDGDDGSPAPPSAKDGGCSFSPRGGTNTGAFGWLALFVLGGIALRRRRMALTLAAGLALSGCGPSDGEAFLGRAEQEVSTPKKAFCKIPVSGEGTKDLENDYLPHVVACEDGGAKLEALKAQAIAARSVAYYELATSGSICDGQGCQVYGCGSKPSELARRAVRETSGMYLTHGGSISYGFYVAGDPGAHGPSCKDGGGATSHYVTYNAGKTGHAVDSTSLGGVGSQNRGCMSQWGARCLDAARDFDFMKILRFYYGADINVVQADGPCVVDADTLKAKLVRKWSSAKRFRAKKADYVVCAGDDFDLALTFRNTGSASWRDVTGRGKGVGDDVFLVTANGKTDKLTGRKRFSVASNENARVRGDHGAKDCVEKGCRKTTFVQGGMPAKAPNKPGVYRSRWRLRDYSKAWKGSHGFGPKVELAVQVESCKPKANDCGCTAWCSDGEQKKLAADIPDGATCKSVAATFCAPAKYLSHSFTPCESSSDAADGANSSDAPDTAGPDGGGDQDDPTNDWNVDTGDGADEGVDEPDDPGFEDDGFDGNADGIGNPSPQGGCAMAPGPAGSDTVAFFAVALALAFLQRRRTTGS
jgi:MYXO-CTERM domain-containing protein